MDVHRTTPWHARTVKCALQGLKTCERGLSDAEAAARLARDGYNELRQRPPKTVARMIAEQVGDPMVLVLVAASALSFALGELAEGVIIAAIIAINTTIGVVQESTAQASLAALRRMGAPSARVLREGEESLVAARELVVGDVVLLSDGDVVPADLRLVESAALAVQEASLTGEPLAAEKDADATLPEGCPLGDRTNMAYASTVVVHGRGAGVVVACGMDTEVGTIARGLDAPDELDTPLKRKLASLGMALTAAGLAVCALILCLGILYQRPFVPQLLVAIALAISVIPEGLPATATVIMALGVRRMAARHALVRKLPAVEALGSATVICTDKTGTLTMNRMGVTCVAVGSDFERGRATDPDELARRHPLAHRGLLWAAALCNDASLDPDRPGEVIGDPTEGALVRLAQDFGIDHDELEEAHPRLFEQPFDSARMRMATVHEVEGRPVAYVKGALDELLPLCTRMADDHATRPLTERDRSLVLSLGTTLSARALRVLGFALRPLARVPEEGEDVERDLVFLGFVGMMDPPRPEVASVVATCRRAGIRTVMITGDHALTAQAIACDLGICDSGASAVSGDDLERMDDDALAGAVRATAVFSRVAPSDKLRIVEALQRNGEVVAMTGDGVNDAPALRRADIGVAMGCGGTDVARDAADLVLLDDSFATIGHAVEEGRRVRRNIQKVIQFLLVGNVAETLTLLVATLFNWEAPLLSVHVLWVNLATATLPALALGVDPADPDAMRTPPARAGSLLAPGFVRRVMAQGICVTACALVAYFVGAGAWGHAVGQTMTFCVLAFAQMLRAFGQRSDAEPAWSRRIEKNPWLVASFVVSATLMAAVLAHPALRDALSVVPLPAAAWPTVVALAVAPGLAAELAKLLRRRPRK